MSLWQRLSARIRRDSPGAVEDGRATATTLSGSIDAGTDGRADDDDDIKALMRRVRAVELRAKKHVSAATSGAWHSRYKGRGMAFSESRAFADGDDPRHVDWLATARTGDLFVKQFVEERELSVLLVVDVSGSMATGTRGGLRRTYAAEVAALLALSAARYHDKVGLVAFSDRLERLVRPAKGRPHVLRLIRDVLALRPQGTRTRLEPALEVATHLSKQRSIVVVISDLVGVQMPVQRLRALATRHDLVVVQIQDPLDVVLPDVGLLSVLHPETGVATTIDTADRGVRAAWKARAEAAQARRIADLRKAGAEHVVIGLGDDDGLRPLLRFLRRRGRRAA